MRPPNMNALMRTPSGLSHSGSNVGHCWMGAVNRALGWAAGRPQSGVQIYINDYQVSVESLRDKLIKIIQGRKDRDVYLKADRSIPYGIVVQVMAEIKAAGVEQLGMITDPSVIEKVREEQKSKS